jgi:hypothetical protein
MNANAAMRKRYRWIGLCVMSCIAGAVFAQTCSAPLQITTVGTYNGNTCSNSNTLPYLANGGVLTPGNEAVYHIAVGAAVQFPVAVTLTPDSGVDLALFVCRGPCSTYSTCIAAVDGGSGVTSSTQLPAEAGDYFIIIGALEQSAGQTCGNYSLTISAPL